MTSLGVLAVAAVGWVLGVAWMWREAKRAEREREQLWRRLGGRR